MVILDFEGKESSSGAQGAGKAASFGKGTQCQKEGKDDTRMHASSGSSSGSSAGPTSL